MTTAATIVLGALFVFAIAYRSWWRRRYRHDPLAEVGLLRLRGVVHHQPEDEIALDRGGGFIELQTDDDKRHLVAIDADVWAESRLPRRFLRHGDRLTIDGMPSGLRQHDRETLYRDSEVGQGIDAVRLMWNTCRPLRGLAPMLSIATLAVVAIGLYSRSDTEWLLTSTEEVTKCPLGTKRETVTGPDGIIQRCRDAHGRKHGAYTIWSWSGELVERGNFYDDKRHGIRDLIRDDGGLQRFTYNHGVLHGPSYVTAGHEGTRRLLVEWIHGKRHGAERHWHDNGVRAFTGYFAHGKPYGTWTYWDRRGRKIAQGDAQGDFRFWDHRQEQTCKGTRSVAEYWLAANVDDAIDAPNTTTLRGCDITCGALIRCESHTSG